MINNSLATQRYLPHLLDTRFNAVLLYRKGYSLKIVCRKYRISKASLIRWNKRFDGTKASLVDKSHKPHTPHKNKHSDIELQWIRNYLRRNPTISIYKLYGKLIHDKGYARHLSSLYKIVHCLGYKKISAQKNVCKPKTYHTPEQIGIKWQIDVKEIPQYCYKGNFQNKFFQYTAIDEASRERFLHPYLEKNALSSVDFIKRAIRYFKYTPQIIQTDNGNEFTNYGKTTKIHEVDIFCQKYNIYHKLIRIRTPKHNGKVERSHGKDQKDFYNTLKFYSYEGLKVKLKKYMRNYNNTPMKILKWKTPKQQRQILLNLQKQ